MANLRENMELFHLLFLDQLGRKVDKRLYALKGGCNLRFYFQSIRYSEDIDLDIQTIRKDTLLKNVQNILESKSLNNILLTRSITIANISTPKQTDITQRWKVALNISSLNQGALHTKIEFSRRGMEGTTLFESVDAALTHHYRLPPILSSHYDRNTAIMQKISALAQRNTTQTRDIFDIYLLLGGASTLPSTNNEIQEKQKKAFEKHFSQALDNTSSISFNDFRSQVVAFLAPEYQKQYATSECWQQIIASVQQMLQRGI